MEFLSRNAPFNYNDFIPKISMNLFLCTEIFNSTFRKISTLKIILDIFTKECIVLASILHILKLE